jgi:proteasome lid subunit RPN8/RPN11
MSERPEPRSQPMPMDRAILWNPPAAAGATGPGRPSGRSPYPVFFQQEAVIALQEHLKSSPTQAIFGFLIGDVYRDPETGVLYTVIDKTLKLSQPIYGDKTEVVVSRLWDRMQEQLKKAAGTLLGWYHSHPGQGGFLTTHDVETHEKFFTDPWQVAILVAAEAGGVTGRFFRSSQNSDWHKTPLPFYELLQPDSIKADGKKRSFIVWRNYKPYGPTLIGPKPKPPEPPKAPPPPPPEAEQPEEAEPEKTRETPAAGGGFRIMRSSADDIPVIKTSADDEPAPPPVPTPPPPPAPRKSAPVFVPKAPPAPKPPPPPPPQPSPPPPPQRSARPARSSDDIPWQVTPAEVGVSEPAPRLVPSEPPPGPRRTPTHTFRLLDEEEGEKQAAPAAKPRRHRRRGPWLKRVAILLLLAGAGAGGYWYLAIRNPTLLPALLDRAKQLVSRITTRSPSPPPAAPRRRPTTGPPTAAPPPAAVPAAPVPVPVPQPVAPSLFARFDRLSDSLSRALRNFQDRASLSADGRMDCGGLAGGLVSIESLWITYNTERRARMASFDQRRASQDQAMYAAVDSVESRFEHSGCPRP